ncbi:MAG: NAD-dependent epimerase/dehydratase family protein, partial [Methanobacterium sp.]|nr:NAD-dependent epimerase/dehydratase family protein [Methanobacterium sp.]
METKRILVTGGSGFIGTNLVSELRSRGHEVLALDLLHHELDDYVRGDVKNYRQLERV